MTVENGGRTSPEEKKAEILRIATQEFARRGYSGASTNTITKRAGISKGILFHYFGSKKELFLLLLREAAERVARNSNAGAVDLPRLSLYDSMAALFLSKAAYYNTYPLDIQLLERAQLEQNADVRTEIVSILSRLSISMRKLRVDVALRVVESSKTRAGITHDEALECILLSLDALDAHFYALYRGTGADIIANPEPMLAKMRLYLDVVARGLFEE